MLLTNLFLSTASAALIRTAEPPVVRSTDKVLDNGLIINQRGAVVDANPQVRGLALTSTDRTTTSRAIRKLQSEMAMAQKNLKLDDARKYSRRIDRLFLKLDQ